MTDKTIENGRPVGGNYFELVYSRKSKLTLQFFLDQFDADDYWIYKSTNHQRLVSYTDLLDFKYSCYVFFKKELYSKDHIDLWIEFMISIGGIQFLHKPLPPFKPLDKIEIRK